MHYWLKYRPIKLEFNQSNSNMYTAITRKLHLTSRIAVKTFIFFARTMLSIKKVWFNFIKRNFAQLSLDKQNGFQIEMLVFSGRKRVALFESVSDATKL